MGLSSVLRGWERRKGPLRPLYSSSSCRQGAASVGSCQAQDDESSKIERGHPVVPPVLVPAGAASSKTDRAPPGVHPASFLAAAAVPHPPVPSGDPRDAPFDHRPVLP